MATAYSSNLALALPVTGELSGTWGTTVNTQITNMLDEALGYQAFSATGGTDTLTIPDGTTGVARSIYIQLTGTGGGTVTVPATKTKMYFVFNDTTALAGITFKVTGGTGVSIPPAGKMALVSNGTNMIVAENYFSALTLGAALPVASGGTGITSFGTGVATWLGTPSSANLAAAVTDETGSGALVFGTSPTFTTSVIGGATMAVFNTASTTVNAFGAATTLNVGAATGTLTVANTTLAAKAITASTTLGVTGVSTLTAGAIVQGLTVGLGAGAVATNTAVGYQAGVANTTGSQHVFIGYQAGSSSVGATNVTAVGYQAASGATGSGITAIGTLAAQNSTGDDNIAVGAAALLTIGSGSANTAIGRSALRFNTTGPQNTAVGYEAGYGITTGNEVVFVGNEAGKNISGQFNTAVGSYALTNFGNSAASGSGTYNSAFGKNTLLYNTSGSYNTAYGAQALQANTTASNNTAVGYQAGYTNQTGTGQTFIGQNAGRTSNPASTTGYNTIIGNQAGYYLDTGVDNTFIGSSVGRGAGQNMTSGSKNTIIGAYDGNQGGLDIRTASNYIVLSDGDGNPRGIFDGNGNLLVGGITQLGKLTVETTAAGAYTGYNRNTNATPGAAVVDLAIFSAASPNNTTAGFYYAGDTAGAKAIIYSNGGLHNYSGNNVNLSDRREKTNFAPAKSYLDVICAIPVQTFNYIDQNLEEDDGLTLGVVAQDVQAVAPELVMESNWASKDEPEKLRLSIYQTDLQYALMKCIQEQQALITQLTARVAQLESKL